MPAAFRPAVASALALLCAAASSAPPAEPRPGQRPGTTPTLPPVRAELVQLDVVVTGRDGRPVADLTSADFQVLEDGRPQPLSHFAVEARPGLREETVVPPAPAPAPAPATGGEDFDPGPPNEDDVPF